MRRNGFSLLEVMLAVAVVGGAVIVLVGSQAGALQAGRRADLLQRTLRAARTELEARRAVGIAAGTDCAFLDPGPFSESLTCTVETVACALAAGGLTCPSTAVPDAFSVVVRVAAPDGSGTELRSIYPHAGRTP